MPSSIRVHSTPAAPVPALLALALALILLGCGQVRPVAPEAAAAPAQTNASLAAAPAPAALPPALPQTRDAAAVTRQLNTLVNDTDPADPQWARLRAELAPLPALPDTLRQAVARVAAFNPPQLRERWQRQREALDSVAALYAEHPPVDTDALRGARVVRRLGPALYLVRLPGGDTAFFATNRRLKQGARLDGVLAVERPRPKPDKAAGDLVDEMADAARTFAAITRQEAHRLAAEHAPVLARLKQLKAERASFQRAINADLASLDALARDVNAVISPRLLGLGEADPGQRPGPKRQARLIRQVKRLGRTYSPLQYYRYALPVTGKTQVDAVLRASLEGRKKDVQELLRSVGVGAGRARTNVDLVGFKAYRASEALLSVRFEAQRDTGGAHPNQGFASFVFDMKSQAVLGLGDIFQDLPAALAVLSELAAWRMELALDGHVFAEGLTPKAENFQVFVLDGADLVFSFPPYQVASYADGPQHLRVPLCHPRLLPLLSPKLLEALGAREAAQARQQGRTGEIFLGA